MNPLRKLIMKALTLHDELQGFGNETLMLREIIDCHMYFVGFWVGFAWPPRLL